MQINEAKVIWIGIGLWAAAFLILLPFRKTLISDGHGWWLYTCLAGAGLGMVGLPMVGRRKTVMARETERGREVGRDVGRDVGREIGREGSREDGSGRGSGREGGRESGGRGRKGRGRGRR
jgi:uncharacterized membrane protein YgcG